jgi:hypothetical protein
VFSGPPQYPSCGFEYLAEGLRPSFDAYKLGEGPSSISIGDLDSGCLEDAAEYINKNNLANIVAVEILDFVNTGHLKRASRALSTPLQDFTYQNLLARSPP